MDRALLSLTNLGVRVATEAGSSDIVENVSFDIKRGEILALVGESGCGKTMTALAIMRLLPWGATASGVIRLDGDDLLTLKSRRMEDLRGAGIGMIFQDPMTSLNPVLTISRQMTEGLMRHRGASSGEAMILAVTALADVGIHEPDRVMRYYPHQLSGGMRQRVMIAAALALGPKLLIADEPTTALDVTVQARVLDLLVSTRNRNATGILLITHDIGVVARSADRAAVMKAGSIVEVSAVDELLAAPRHPYTSKLLDSYLSLDRIKIERGWAGACGTTNSGGDAP